jgi:hypothetical protein
MDETFKEVYNEILSGVSFTILMSTEDNEAPPIWNEAMKRFMDASRVVLESNNEEAFKNMEMIRGQLRRIALLYAQESNLRLTVEEENRVWTAFCWRVFKFDFTNEEKNRLFRLV